ncbi:MAG: hypothetical protein K0U37_04040 [Gammaproteobacteria bacterium]|nr:hypothetical protein [Gammaproteobacteria bacterium]
MKSPDDDDATTKKNIAYASSATAFFSCFTNPTEYFLSPSTKPNANIKWLAFFPGITPTTLYIPKENAHPDTTSPEKKKN